MGQSGTYQSALSNAEFELLSANLLAQAPRLSAAQMLELADQLHDLIRTRQAAERSFARRHARHIA